MVTKKLQEKVQLFEDGFKDLDYYQPLSATIFGCNSFFLRVVSQSIVRYISDIGTKGNLQTALVFFLSVRIKRFFDREWILVR